MTRRSICLSHLLIHSCVRCGPSTNLCVAGPCSQVETLTKPVAAAPAPAAPAAAPAPAPAPPAASKEYPAPAAPPAAVSASSSQVLIFEVSGGAGKGPDGYRRDTWPLIKGLESAGCTAEVICWQPANDANILQYAAGKRGFISRVEPGDLSAAAAPQYAALLAALKAAGLAGFGDGAGALKPVAEVQHAVLASLGLSSPTAEAAPTAAAAELAPAVEEAAGAAEAEAAAAEAEVPAAEAAAPAASNLKDFLIFEVAGGAGKGPDGYRRDTWPLIKFLEKAGCVAEVVCWQPENDSRIQEYAKGKRGFISRVEAGDLSGAAAEQYAALLAALIADGLVGFGDGGGVLQSAMEVQDSVLASLG